MPVSPTYPGVYIEEVPSGVRTITGVPTSITAFLGPAARGPINEAVTLNSYADFERTFGGLSTISRMPYAVRDFFVNGGTTAIVVRLFRELTPPGDAKTRLTGLLTKIVTAANAGASAAEAQVNVRQAANVEIGTRATAGVMKTFVDLVLANKDTDVKKVQDFATALKDRANDFAKMTIVGTNKTRKDNLDALQKGLKVIETANKAAVPLAQAMLDQARGALGADDQAGTGIDQIVKAEAKAIETLEGKLKTASDLADLRKKARDEAAASAEAVKTSLTSQADIDAFAGIVAAAEKSGSATAKDVGDKAQTAGNAQLASTTLAMLTDGVLTLRAANNGSWGKALRARVDPKVRDTTAADPDKDKLFNLTVSDGVQVESFANVSIRNGSARQVDKVLENDSRLIRWQGDLPATVPTAHNPPPSGQNPFGDYDASDRINAAPDPKVAVTDGARVEAVDYIGSQANSQGMYALQRVDLFNLLCIPPYTTGDGVDGSVLAEAVALCERRRAMLLVDPDPLWNNDDNVKTALDTNTYPNLPNKNAALYFPRLKQPDPLNGNRIDSFAPCGAIAGIFARTDAARGVWKAPAGLEAGLLGVSDLSVKLTDRQNGNLNPLGVNCLRTFPVVGSVVWGARTLRGADRLADADNRYVPVRRLTLFIEESLYRGTQFAVFEPNGQVLWGQLRLAIGSFMQNLFNQGAFAGKTASEAFFVKCDNTTTTQIEIDLGKVVVDIGFAPLKPAEFVVLRIQQMAGQSTT